VWLNAEQLSPYDYWQFWRNVDDADVGKFLRLFTDLPLDEIARLEALDGAAINDAKKALADAATTMLHGAGEADKARAAAEGAFERGTLSADLPTFTVDRQQVLEGAVTTTSILIMSEVVPSRNAARREIMGGGIRINGTKVADAEQVLSLSDFGANGELELAKGKKTRFRAKLT